MADYTREIRINAYTENAQQGFRNLDQAIQQNNQNLEQNKKKASESARSFNDLVQAADTVAKSLNEASKKLLELNQKYKLMSDSTRNTLTHVQEFTERLSQQGVVAGTLTTALEAYVELLASAGWIERRTQNISDLTRSMDELRERAEAQLALEQREASIGKDLNTTQAELLATRARANAVRQRLAEIQEEELRTGRRISENYRTRQRELFLLTTRERELEQATRDLLQAQQEEENRRLTREAQQRAAAAADERDRRAQESWDRYNAAVSGIREQRLQRLTDYASDLAKVERERLENLRLQTEVEERIKTQNEAYEESQRNRLRERREELTQARGIVEDFNRSWQSGLDNVISTFQTTNEQLRELRTSVLSNSRLIDVGLQAIGNSVIENIGGNFSQAFSQAILASVTGAEDFGKAMEQMAASILNALLQESVVQVIVETARGIASLASYQYDAAALHFASAGTWGAVGAAAGIGAGALAASTQSANTPTTSPSSGNGISSGSEREKGGNTYNITISGNMIGTKKDAARYIQNSLERYAN